MKINKEHYYKISDLALATALSLYFSIKKIEAITPRQARFVFQKSKQLDKLVRDYWQGKVKVEPQTYFNKLKNVKSRLYSEIKISSRNQ